MSASPRPLIALLVTHGLHYQRLSCQFQNPLDTLVRSRSTLPPTTSYQPPTTSYQPPATERERHCPRDIMETEI
jgi:hypothetical protein